MGAGYDRRIGRREFLKTSAGLGAGLGTLAFPAAHICAQDRGPIILLGMHGASGPFAGSGQFGVRGVEIALEERNYTVLGRKIEHVVRDTELKPAVAVRKAREVIEGQGARFMVGTLGSHVALALSELCQEKKVLFMVGDIGTDLLTGEKCHQYVFRWATQDWGISRSAVKPFLEKLGVKSMYTLTSDFAWGQSLLKATSSLLDQAKVKHLGNAMAPLGESNFTPHLLKARSAGADAVNMIFYGADQVKVMKQAAEFGLKGQSKILCSWSGLDMLKEMGPEVVEGGYYGLQGWHEVDTPVTKHVVAKYRAKYKENPGYQAMSYYTITKVLFDQIEKAGKAEPEAVIPRLGGLEFDGPNGKEMFRKWDHQNTKPFFLMKGKAKGAMRDPDDFLEPFASEAIYPSQAENPCRLT